MSSVNHGMHDFHFIYIYIYIYIVEKEMRRLTLFLKHDCIGIVYSRNVICWSLSTYVLPSVLKKKKKDAYNISQVRVYWTEPATCDVFVHLYIYIYINLYYYYMYLHSYFQWKMHTFYLIQSIYIIILHFFERVNIANMFGEGHTYDNIYSSAVARSMFWQKHVTTTCSFMYVISFSFVCFSMCLCVCVRLVFSSKCFFCFSFSNYLY